MVRMAVRGRLSPKGDSAGSACFEKGWRILRIAACSIAALLAPAAATSGNVVEYSYDAAGNIIQLKRQAVGALAVTGFTPASGAVGAAVTILGSGFSATPANNTVRFNGVVAAVSAADTGSLAVTVPAGATTGRISVTVGASTATSAQDFIVVIPGAPTIASFTPVSGAAGTSVSVTGTNFDTTAGATVVKLNGVTATATVTTAADLAFTVPGATATGRITATTSAGTGASATDFIVPPPGINAADIVSTLRLPTDGSYANLAVGTAYKYGALLFDGSADTYYTVQFGQFATSPTSATISYQVIKPDNTVLASGNVGNANRPTIHLPKLPATGTYSVLLGAGSATLNTNARLVTDPIISVDGVVANSALDFANQSMRFVFDATAGQRIGVGVTNVVGTPSAGSVGFAAFQPDGSSLSAPALPYCAMPWPSNNLGSCDGELVATVAGTYTLVGSSYWGTYDNFTLVLNSEVTGSLAADLGQDVTLGRVGQDARFTFAATAGDSLAIDVSGIVPQTQPQSFNANVYRPDGSYFASCSSSVNNGAYCELGAVPVTGTYSVWIDPANGAYGSFKLTLKQGPPIAATDPAAAFATSAAGESVRFRFAVAAGQSFAVGVTNLAYIGTSGIATNLKVFGPDRTQIGSTASCSPTAAGGTCKITLSNMAAGTYSVVLSPPADVKITGYALLSSDLTGTLAAGSPVNLNATRAGQNARFTFSGTAGDSTSVKLVATSTTPASQAMYLHVYGPTGTLLGWSSANSPAAVFVNLTSLPSTGTYTALVQPGYGATWQGQLVLDPGAALPIDGAVAGPVSGAIGEPLRFWFSGSASQRADLGLTGYSLSPPNGNYSSLVVYKPDGNYIAWIYCYTSGTGSCDASYVNLPVAGTYAVVLVPPATSAITGGSIAISTPLAGSFVIGDPAQTVAISRPGQTARYTFAGAAAQLLRLNWTGTTVSGGASVAVTVLKPDGTTLSSGSFVNAATGGLDIAALPTTGTYTVVFDSAAAASMSAPISLITR